MLNFFSIFQMLLEWSLITMMKNIQSALMRSSAWSRFSSEALKCKEEATAALHALVFVGVSALVPADISAAPVSNSSLKESYTPGTKAELSFMLNISFYLQMVKHKTEHVVACKSK